jgi:predicted unusual protein kinase regulating ubiquinone biosynthesis (AarF/ABC1/UbiB family)
VATAAVAVAAHRRRSGHTSGVDSDPPGDPAGHPISARSRRQRRAQLARMGGRAGADFALHRARRVFAGAERHSELDRRFELRTAEQVADALGNMKGAFMKLGQMASYLDTGLPPHVREALAGLQQDAPPMSAQLAAGVVERELGAPPDRVFLEWDPVPIASASIGQVHRAITRDGRAVAVKVQYPGVDQAITADLEAAGLVFGAMGLALAGFEPGPLVEEIRARVVEELDYANEARNQQLFADFYRGHPFVHVPDVLMPLSTPRVLTTELAEGARFDEMATWPQDERNLAAEAIYRFVFRSLYRLAAFNGDPHPGNYLFRPGGHVTFLDFGLVKRFTPGEIEMLARMSQTFAVERDMKAFREVVAEAGFLKDSTRFTDDQLRDYFNHFWAFVLEDEPMATTPEWSSESVRRFFDPTGEHGEIMRAANVPAAFVILQRINLGLGAVLGELRATCNWRRIAEEQWPFVARPPSTPLGELEAAWRAGQPDTSVR